jgi:nucleotide-binding universal stress UspA family protein
VSPSATGASGGPAQEILVATDFSEIGAAALGVGAQYARALHARLHLVHVSTEDADAARLLADAAGEVGADVPVVVARTGGDPAEAILRYGTQHRIDLIVVGTHGRTGVSRVLLGSVAERVVRGARCPVLVVPAPRPGATPEPAASMPVGVAQEAGPPAPARPCLVCATPSHDLICEPCRARIRGEALEHKRSEERPGRA